MHSMPEDQINLQFCSTDLKFKTSQYLKLISGNKLYIIISHYTEPNATH